MSQRVKKLPPPTEPPVDEEPLDGHELRMTFWEHLDELRKRVFASLLSLIIGTVIGIAIAGPVLAFLMQPYGQELVVLGPTEGVVSYFRVAMLIGAILSIPMVTYQLLLFILPGLTRKEQRTMLISLPAITALFLVGAAFAWFILVPPALNFLEGFQEDLFRPEWTVDLYLSFVTALIFWMGVAFETPLIFFVLSIMGLVEPRILIRNWRIAIVGAAIAAAIITPTVDPVNMGLVIVPLLVLYIISIVLVWFGNRLNVAK
jgi:sec-independent protein translocase protein TatC